MVLHGLFGPTLAPKNMATVLAWVHFRGVLVATLLLAGNFFCLACPLMLVRNGVRKFVQPVLDWPRVLRNKWLSLSLLVLILFFYELVDLWASPWWTAWLIVAYFVGAIVVDSVFKHASFCKFVCPIGQYNFVASTVSPLEIRVREQDVCSSCKTKDCIRGQKSPELVTIQRGCELALFQPRKTGNLDCTFCLDCVQACPHDNIGVLSRIPAEELTIDRLRSGVGYISRRKDLAALSLVFCFGALLNAFGMVRPIYSFESWIAGLLGLNREAPVLALIFLLFLVVEPVLLIGAAAWITRRLSNRRKSVLATAVHYSFVLVPLGFGIWLAHYGFHFLTGLFTFIPVVQNAVADLGRPLLGQPRWTLVGFSQNVVRAFEYGFLSVGFVGSLLVSHRLVEAEKSEHPHAVFAVWALVAFVLWSAALWLMSQPMEMRGVTLLGG